MSEVLSRAQPYIQVEEAMKTSSNHSVKLSDGGGKSNSTHEAPNYSQDLGATCLQESSVLDPPTKSTWKLYISGMLHSTETPDQ